MHTDFLSSNAQHRQQARIGSLLVPVGVLMLATGCTQAAGLHDHEAYRGFPDSRSKVLCSTGGSLSQLRVPCGEALEANPQDGHLENSKPEYTVEGNDIRDSITGLVWRKQATTAPNYKEAQHVCESLGGGYRLPSRLELISLLDYGGSSVLIDTSVFENTEPMRYRTGMLYDQRDPQFDATHWGVTFVGQLPLEVTSTTLLPGETHQLDDSNESGVICVRNDSGPYVSGPFEPAGVENKFLRDTRTGLLWFAKGIEVDSWAEAVTKCKTALNGSYGDFRLPNAKELATLVDDNAPKGSTSRLYPQFILDHNPYLWSSTPTPDPRYALALSTSGASIARWETNLNYYQALCVRGPD